MTSATQTTIALEKHELSMMMLMTEERLKAARKRASSVRVGTPAHRERGKVVAELVALQAKLEASYRETYLARK